MKPSELLRTSTFRLALLYMVLFGGSALLLLGFIYWSTVAFMANQTDATIEAEIVGLAEQYRERGLTGLVETISERLERDPESASVYLFASRNYTPLAGNLTAWPDVAPAEGGWSGEASSVVHEHCFHDLKRPVKRHCAIRTGIPYGPVLERQVIPSEDSIVEATRELVE